MKKVLNIDFQLVNTEFVFCYGQKAYSKFNKKRFDSIEEILNELHKYKEFDIDYFMYILNSVKDFLLKGGKMFLLRGGSTSRISESSDTIDKSGHPRPLSHLDMVLSLIFILSASCFCVMIFSKRICFIIFPILSLRIFASPQ